MEEAVHETISKRKHSQPGQLKEEERKLKSLIKKTNSTLSLKVSRPKKIILEITQNEKRNKILNTCNKLNESASSRKDTKECCDTFRVLRNELNKLEKPIDTMIWKDDSTRCKSSEENAQVF